MAEWDVKVAGTWRKLVSPAVKVAGTWQPIKQGWVKVAGTWRQFFANLSVQLLTTGSYQGVAANATIQFANTGVFTGTGPVGGATSPYNWLLSGSASQVDIRVTPTSGSWSSGTTGTWLNLATSRSWTINWPGGISSSSVTSTIELRDASSLVVLASGSLTVGTHP